MKRIYDVRRFATPTVVCIAALTILPACNSKHSRKTATFASTQDSKKTPQPQAITKVVTESNATPADPAADNERPIDEGASQACADPANTHVSGFDESGKIVCTPNKTPTVSDELPLDKLEKPFIPRLKISNTCASGTSFPFPLMGEFFTIESPDGPTVEWYTLYLGLKSTDYRDPSELPPHKYKTIQWPRSLKISADKVVITVAFLGEHGFFVGDGAAFVRVTANNAAGSSAPSKDASIDSCPDIPRYEPTF